MAANDAGDWKGAGRRVLDGARNELAEFLSEGRRDAELRAEIESYMAEEMAENVAHGMTEDEARRQARIKFGNQYVCARQSGSKTA